MTDLAPSMNEGPTTGIENHSLSIGEVFTDREGVERRTSAVTALAWKCTLLLVFALVLEGTARIDDWIRYEMPLFTRVVLSKHLLVRDADGAHGRPNARYKRWAMNAFGMQGPDVSPTKSPRTLRIVTLGASETAGFTESVGREYPRQLEQRLREALAGVDCGGAGRTSVELLNAALAGMSLPTQTQDVWTRLRRLDVDVVTVYPSPVQYLTPLPPRAASPDFDGVDELPVANAFRPRVWLRLRDEAKSLTPAFVKEWLWRRHVEKLAQAHPADWRFTAVPQDRLAMFERDLRALVAAIREIGAVPILGTHANVFMRPGPHDSAVLAQWEHFYARATGRTIIEFDAAARLAMIRVARDMRVTLVDVADRLSTAEGKVFSDSVHFTDHGAGIVAEAFVAGVLSSVPEGACVRAARVPVVSDK